MHCEDKRIPGRYSQSASVPHEGMSHLQVLKLTSDRALELEFLERYDSQQLFSNFYFLFGRAEFVVQAAPGPGIISDMMLLSDDLDEVDWEFRGAPTSRR